MHIMDVSIYRGSILDCDVDAIVNPANSFLDHKGGLAYHINTAAEGGGVANRDWLGAKTLSDFYAVTREYREFRPGLIPTGGAVLGPPGALCRRFKAIIHAVGPIWGGGDYHELELLQSAYWHALRLSEDNEYSVAFPAISAGVFGVPIRRVAACAFLTLEVVKPAQPVMFALMDDEHVDTFKEVAEKFADVFQLREA